MTYESVVHVESQVAPGVTLTIRKMSYGRRAGLMRRIRELARRQEFLRASEEPADKMDVALIETEINREYVKWGLQSVSGLTVDGEEATPEILSESGPEDLFREALEAVRRQTGLSAEERKN
ncbi:MAG TPA: hypothetical protein VKV17_20695 [Bryobacteraceae bacterium]|nr:hypothetical protein [Bryobacteraceae bacterium]